MELAKWLPVSHLQNLQLTKRVMIFFLESKSFPRWSFLYINSLQFLLWLDEYNLWQPSWNLHHVYSCIMSTLPELNINLSCYTIYMLKFTSQNNIAASWQSWKINKNVIFFAYAKWFFLSWNLSCNDIDSLPNTCIIGRDIS